MKVTKAKLLPSMELMETFKEKEMKSTLEAFKKKYGEGTAADLDYGKLTIIALCIYIAVQVS
tara:strand:+ start:418 stop:603 length:186 start_codon:yes stop_codon:yes gene_type:complete